MNLTIIYGCRKNGSTHHVVELIKNNFLELEDVSFDEIWLTDELTNICKGCFNCISYGEEKCTESNEVDRIIKSIEKSDGIILVSPVYGLDVSALMKNFIDHTCYMWLPHRPKKDMFNKIGLVISTCAGQGTKRTNKTMKNMLINMGVKKVLSFGKSVKASCWADVSENDKIKIANETKIIVSKMSVLINNSSKIKTPIYQKFKFFILGKLINSYDDENIDKIYWKEMGWLDGIKPF